MCFSWLHARSNVYFYSLNTWYTIPVIIISTLTGTANFAQNQVPIQYQKSFGMIIGGFNLLAGIISTIQQFLKITQLSESHRLASVGWEKYYRNIRIELSKESNKRIHFSHFIKSSKEEFDRLMETSPIVPNKIINEFKYQFKVNDSFIKPEICDALVSTDLSRNPWTNKHIDMPISSNTFLYKTKDKPNVEFKDPELDKKFKDLELDRNFKDPELDRIITNDVELTNKIDEIV